MSDAHDKIDALLNKKEKTTYARDFEQVKDNYKFAHKVENEPVSSQGYDEEIFNYKVLNFNDYISQQAWPSSLYFIDKIVRLNMRASMEWMKKNLSKKRTVPMSMIWLLLLFGVVGIVVLVVIMMILPMLGV